VGPRDHELEEAAVRGLITDTRMARHTRKAGAIVLLLLVIAIVVELL
jgi:hypothetical protein